MFRIIDLDSFSQNQDQTVFTFLAGNERHGIPAAELFDLLKNRLAQNTAGKAANRKNTTQKRSSALDSSDQGEFNGPGTVSTGDGAEETSLS